MSQKLNISQLFRERMRRDSDNQLEAWLLWEFICGSVGRDEILHHRLKPGDDVNLDYSLTIDGRKTDLTDLLDRIVSHFETRVEEHAKAEIAEGIRDRKELLVGALVAIRLECVDDHLLLRLVHHILRVIFRHGCLCRRVVVLL